jgi:hypothetical protein
MMNRLRHHCSPLLRLFVFLLMLPSLLACASKYISVNQIDSIDQVTINKIAIVPFGVDRMSSGESHDIAGEGAAVLTELVETELNQFYYLIPREKVVLLLYKTGISDIQKIVTTLGSELDVDAVLMGIVTHYQSRKGNTYAATEPASVAFELYLISGKNSELLWSASFDKTQKSLSEDVGNITSFLQGEWKWLTTAELMERGVKQIVNKFPGMRQRKKLKKLKPLNPSLSSDTG